MASRFIFVCVFLLLVIIQAVPASVSTPAHSTTEVKVSTPAVLTTDNGLHSYTCNPSIDCQFLQSGEFVPDENDCERYFICLDGGSPSAASFSCPEDQFFDQTTNQCETELLPGFCPYQCIRFEYGHCPIDCSYWDVNDGLPLIADPNNCTVFYICGQGAPVEITCSLEQPYFNGENCNTNEAECCKPCVPICETDAFTEIVDPCDCTSFYVCEAVGPANSALRGNCQTDYFFDEPSQQCVPGNCTSICSSEQC